MLAVRFTVFGLRPLSSDPSSTSSRLFPLSHSSLHLGFRRSRRSGVLLISCRSQASWNTNSSSDGSSDLDDDFVQATLLFSESVSHYKGLKYGVVEEASWKAAGGSYRLPLKEPQRSVMTIGQGVLRQFLKPTVFLKISCDGDFLLPIAVEGHAIERLADASWEDKDDDYPNQFQFVKNLVLRLGYEVDMVRITKRVRNTYFAKVSLNKPGETGSINIDICPSDAINIAKRCLAPIYISKQIVTRDVFQIAYGMIRTHSTKAVYDVTLDSPPDGPDMLVKELNLVKSMKLAVAEERYNDAAIIRDQLMGIRKT